MSFVGSTIRNQGNGQDVQIHGKIDLIDNTVSQDEAPEIHEYDIDEDDPKSPKTPLSKRSTRLTLREELAKRKYRKYQEERYQEDATAGSRPGASRTATVTTTNPATPTTETIDEHPTAKSKRDRIRRGQQRFKGLFRHQRQRVDEGDTATDVLYENARGWFFFGMPYFSSAALIGKLDDSPWTDAYGQPSAVSTTNAQLPDPSWDWVWNTWYVDMSWDVDEQGWQYSFMFQKRFAWHGNHPWFHSFVRRRRWLRKRVRKPPAKRIVEEPAGPDSMSKAHVLNSDYFTIHPRASNYPASSAALSPNDDSGEDEEDVDNIQALLRRLKDTQVDRAKIDLVLRFLDQGGPEVAYLADEIPHILSLFLFQFSRRNLLSEMMQRIDAASDHRDEHKQRDEPEYENEKAKIDNLVSAVKAADKEIQKLEFWSDIKAVVQRGESYAGIDHEKGWDHGWAGLDRSGPSAVADSGPISKEDKKPEVVGTEPKEQ